MKLGNIHDGLNVMIHLESFIIHIEYMEYSITINNIVSKKCESGWKTLNNFVYFLRIGGCGKHLTHISGKIQQQSSKKRFQ